jgi:phage terminase large subunit
VNIQLPYNWKQRFYQNDLWQYLSKGGKRAVANWHRRSGKDEVFLHHTACAAHEKIGTYWYMLPEYSQARKSMWDSINPHTGKKRIDEAFPQEIRKTTRDHEMMIVFQCGSTFQLVGSDNFNSLVGSPPVGLIFSEYALSNPAAWAYLRPILLENRGWAGFNSTPRGNNHFKALCKHAEVTNGWFYQRLTAEQTKVFTPEQLQDELLELQSLHGDDYGKSLWLQEYFCSFDAAIPGSIWGDCLDKLQNRGNITDVPHDPKFPVHTGWDLGRTDATAIWFFQMSGKSIDVIGYHESNFKDIPFYGDLLRGIHRPDDSSDVRALKDRTKKFKYGTHWLPHDARARTLAAGGKSIQQQMIDQNVGRIVIAKKLDHVDGIQGARATFPYCRFDKTYTADGIDVLRNYHYEWDEERQTFSNQPAHDWSSHGSSAFRTLSLSWKRPKDRGPEEAPLVERIEAGSIHKQTFGQLKEKHLRKMRSLREERM